MTDAPKIERSDDLAPWAFRAYDADGALVVSATVEPCVQTVAVPDTVVRIVAGTELYASVIGPTRH